MRERRGVADDRPLVGVDIGRIADVVPFALEKADGVVFPPAQEIAGAVEANAVGIHGVRAIERHLARRRVAAVEGVNDLPPQLL